MPATKIATCCYCGTKAALVLRGETHHELSCSNCGAPLQAMKMLPKGRARATGPAATPAHPQPSWAKEAKVKKSKKRKKKKSFKERAWGEFWDAIEDIFD